MVKKQEYDLKKKNMSVEKQIAGLKKERDTLTVDGEKQRTYLNQLRDTLTADRQWIRGTINNEVTAQTAVTKKNLELSHRLLASTRDTSRE